VFKLMHVITLALLVIAMMMMMMMMMMTTTKMTMANIVILFMRT